MNDINDQPMVKVSIIVPSYNSAQYLPEALESALCQTYQDYEIIVIDDGSTDQTKDIVQGFAADHPEKIRYIYQENKGLAVARNTAIKHARGKFLALLDSDDKWLPERLEYTVKAIESDDAVGLAYCDITYVDEAGTPLGSPERDSRYLSGNIFEYIFLRKVHIVSPSVIFRKSCCDQVGGFDENLARLGCEDRDLWLRISQQYKAVYVDKVLALYRVRKTSMSRKREKMMRARLYVIDKYCPAGGNGRNLRRKALAKIYHDLGDEYLLERKFNESRKQYAKALTQNPLSFWSWLNILKAVLRVKIKEAN